MSDIVIVAKDNAYGLTRHSAILAAALERAGHHVVRATPRSRAFLDWALRRQVADIVIHLERVSRRWLNAGRVQLLMPMQERYPGRQLPLLRRLDAVLANTHEAERVFSGAGVRVIHVGFASPDRAVNSATKDWSRFLHVAGGSTEKGTEEILRLWRGHPEWPELVLVQKAENAPSSAPPNVRLIAGYLDDQELKTVQNACGVHLCPSRSEGWGHYILEAMSCGAVTVTTDAPPMNEHVSPESGVLVGWSRSDRRHLGTSYRVDADALERAVVTLLATSDAEKAAIGVAARRRYEQICAGFENAIAALDFDAFAHGKRP